VVRDPTGAEGRGPCRRFARRHHAHYADVLDLVNRTGNTLHEIGVEPENRVLMLCLDAPEFIGTFWGAIKIGAVPIPTNTLMRAADYLYFLNDSRAKVAVVSAPLLAEAGPALAEAKYLKHVLVAGGAPGRFMGYEDRVAKASATLDAA
jgi:benzoate-CoA ligase